MLETKIDIKKTALLVIDMQNGLIKVEDTSDELTRMVESRGVISNTAKVIEAARQVIIPLIFSVHVNRKDGTDFVPTIADSPFPHRLLVEGTPGAAIVDELKPTPEDYIVPKRRANAFYSSDLELLLRCLGIDTVIITGVVTNGCIAATVEGALSRDFHVIVLSDCCAAAMSEDDDYFMKRKFPLVARVRTSGEMVAAIAKASPSGR